MVHVRGIFILDKAAYGDAFTSVLCRKRFEVEVGLWVAET